MRILILSPVFPYPPVDGDKIRIFNIIKHLKKQGKHELHLVTFCRPFEEALKPELGKYFDTVDTVVLDKTGIIGNAFRGLFGGMPLNAAAYSDARMKAAVKEAYNKYSPGLIFTYRLRMAQYASGYQAPKVIDYVDSLALFMKRSAGFEGSIFKKLYYLFDGPRVEKYERLAAADFESVFINSEEDALYLGNENIITAANGAMKAGRPVKAGHNGIYTVGFMGNMPYGPNREAVRWFVKNVWKKTFNNDKNIRLVIAGRGANVFGSLAGGNVELKDNVRDVEKEISSWDLSAVPVRYGAGRQNKVMDCWACGVPVIAAPFAAKGVYGKDGFNMLIAGNKDEFAEKIKLLRNKPAIGRKLAGNAKATLKRYFDWDKTGNIINRAILKAAK
jgi:glycosyltransferase involved in cell wall biosynthesis